MKSKSKIIISIIIAIYFLFLLDYKGTYSNKNWTYNVEIKGLLWVALDYYTIVKYNSNDSPMKWINYNKVKPQKNLK